MGCRPSPATPLQVPPPAPRESFRAGLRAAIPFAIVAVVLSLSFGVLAREIGFSAFGAIVMSAIVFAGSAQFAAVAILGGGGGRRRGGRPPRR